MHSYGDHVPFPSYPTMGESGKTDSDDARCLEAACVFAEHGFFKVRDDASDLSAYAALRDGVTSDIFLNRTIAHDCFVAYFAKTFTVICDE